jgi:hypothetical protein
MARTSSLPGWWQWQFVACDGAWLSGKGLGAVNRERAVVTLTVVRTGDDLVEVLGDQPGRKGRPAWRWLLVFRHAGSTNLRRPHLIRRDVAVTAGAFTGQVNVAGRSQRRRHAAGGDRYKNPHSARIGVLRQHDQECFYSRRQTETIGCHLGPVACASMATLGPAPRGGRS